jgi:adenine-specific DNA-methyltransferase
MHEVDADLQAEYAKLTKDELIALLCERRPEGTKYVFSGKANSRRIVRLVKPRAQQYVKELSVGTPDQQAKNLILEGECLQAMVSLHKYHGTVDLIVADPPYNTGSDFRYNDKWEEDPNDPDPGELVKKDDGSRFTKWARFILPRLYMMRSMLKQAGIVAICIDDNELFQLGLMMDEVFGQENRIAIINWQKAYAPKNDSRHVSTATEYVLIYAKDRSIAKTGLTERTEGMNAKYRNPDNDPDGVWREDNATSKDRRDRDRYAIQNPFTGDLMYPGSRSWRLPKAKFKLVLEQWGSEYVEKDINDGRAKALVLKSGVLPPIPKPGTQNFDEVPILSDPAVREHMAIQLARQEAELVRETKVWPVIGFGGGGQGRPFTKRHLKFVKQGKVPLTYWANEDYYEALELGSVSWNHEESGHSQTGINELNAIVGRGHEFDTVKPLKLISKIIQLWCPPNGRVLDPFAGSGTTGHAVLMLNEQTDSDREFILIEQGNREKSDRFARTLTAERLRRVVTGVYESGAVPPLSAGFQFCHLTKKVDAKAVLAMEREELIDLLLSSHWDKDRRNRTRLVRHIETGYKHLIAKDSEDVGYFLLWNGNSEKDTTLDYQAFAEIVKEGKRAKVSAPYVVYARFETYQAKEVRFYKIPDRVLLHLGINDVKDPYNEIEEDF